jgi:ribosome biogenesis GTPase
MTDASRALVLSTGKNAAWVALDGETEPRVATLRRMTGKRSMPVPGDIVFVQMTGDGKTVIERIEPRTFTLDRRSVDGRSKTMAANIDLLVTVTALAEPAARTVTLDQLLAFAELETIEAVVIFTKPDLADAQERARLESLYQRIGYTTLVINPKRGENVAEFRAMIANRKAMLCGISGVGKSSIFRALGGDAAVGDVSRFGLGRQTTSASRLYRMGEGFLIDSPGVNEFGLGEISSSELTPGFREMTAPAQTCRFSDCSHLQEPDCGVKAAVASGKIDASRYTSFRKILTEPT